MQGQEGCLEGQHGGEGQGFPLTVRALRRAHWLVGACLVLFSFSICFFNSHLDKNTGSKGERVCSLDSAQIVGTALESS